MVPIFGGRLFGCGGDQRGVNVNPAVECTDGKGRREHGLFQLAKPGLHTVGFLTDGDRVLHMGHVAGREHFKGVGYKPKPPVVANALQEAQPGVDSPRNVNVGANHLRHRELWVSEQEITRLKARLSEASAERSAADGGTNNG